MSNRGAILQLACKGEEDLNLTAIPTYDPFAFAYTQYYDFAKELAEIQLNENADFGKKITVFVPRNGHLLSSLYLNIQLPTLIPTSGAFASWSDALGYAIFDGPIELEIGGQVVDRLYPEHLDITDELTETSQKTGLDLMILKSDIYSAAFANAINPVNLIIPLPFWFVKSVNLSLPLCSMTTQEIRVNFKLKNFGDVINYDGDTPPDPVSITNASLFAEYTFLDYRLIKQFQQKEHRFLISQTLFDTTSTIQKGIKNFHLNVPFNHPCKEIFIVAKDSVSIANNDYFNYSRPSDGNPIINELSLILDGKPRFSSKNEKLFRTVTCKNTHSVIPTKYIYCLPFCDKPELNQPTGSLNLSCFSDVQLSINVNNDNDSILYVFANVINFVNIKDGCLYLEYM